MNYPFIFSIFPAALVYLYMEYILLIRYARAMVPIMCFLDRGFLLTKKIINQALLVLSKLKSPQDLVSYCGISVSQMTTDMFNGSKSQSRAFLRLTTERE